MKKNIGSTDKMIRIVAGVILILILLFSLPRVFSLFRRKSAEDQRYFEVTPGQRWIMAVMYFGLIALLVLGMGTSYITPAS